MDRPSRLMVLALAVTAVLAGLDGRIVSHTGAAPAPEGPGVDRLGDALPPNAVARLGAARLRHSANALAFAPDAKTFATAGSDRLVRLWDASTGKEIRRFKGHEQAVVAVIFSPDSKSLLSSAGDGIRVWEVESGKQRSLFGQDKSAVRSFTFAPDQKALLAIGTDASIYEWDWNAGKVLREIVGPRGGVMDVVLSPDGKLFVERTGANVLLVYDMNSGKELVRILARRQLFSPPIFSPDGKTLIVGVDRGLMQWEVATGKVAAKLEAYPPGPVMQVSFTADGKSLLTYSLGREHAQLWDLEVGKELRRFDPQMSGRLRLILSPDGKKLAAHDGNTIVRLWDTTTGRELVASDGHLWAIEYLRFTPDGKQLLTTSYPMGRARLWDAATGKVVALWDHPNGGVVMPQGQDGRTLLVGNRGGVNRFVLGEDKGTGRVIFEKQDTLLVTMAASPDGKRLATFQDKTITFWDLETGKEAGKLDGNLPLCRLVFSPDSRFCATGGNGQPIRIWDVSSGKEVSSFEVINQLGVFGTKGTVSFTFSPDGRSLLTAGIQVRLWEIATGRVRWHQNLTLTNYGVAGAFSPDGKMVAVGLGHGEVRLLETYTGQQLADLPGHGAGITALAFAPDGKRLASGSADTTALVWDVKPFAARARPAPAEVKPADVAALWKRLADPDPASAYKAAAQLETAPDQAIPLLKKQLQAAVDPDHVAKLIRSLDAEEFDTRQKAHDELKGLEQRVVPALQKALDAGPGVEARRRITELLEGYDKTALQMAEVRELRGLDVLEHLGSKEAVLLLEVLAKGAPTARVTREARAALERLARAPAP